MNRMINVSMLFMVFIFVLPCAEAKDELKVTYIANEGFLFESGGHKVVTDPLFGKEDLSFCDVPPPEVIEKLLAAKSPFDNVDVVFISHDHVDHFDEAMVLEYLENNTHCKVVTTEQAEERLKKHERYEKLKGRILAFYPPAGVELKLIVNGINMTIMRLKHCTYMEIDKETGKEVDRHRNKQNLGILFEVGGNKIFHNGDSAMENPEEYKAFNLIEREIDVALSGSLFWQPLSEKVELVNKTLQPKQLIAMHLSKGRKSKYKAYKDTIQESLPPIWYFESPMDWKVYPSKAKAK